MPFYSTYSNLKVLLDPKTRTQVQLCRGGEFRYRVPKGVDKEDVKILYEGDFDPKDCCFHSEAKFRVQIDRVCKTDSDWKIFLKWFYSQPVGRGTVRYKEDISDISGHVILDEKWTLPLWVLDELVKNKTITSPNMLQNISNRKKIEAVTPPSEAVQEDNKEDAKVKAEAQAVVAAALHGVDPLGEFTK